MMRAEEGGAAIAVEIWSLPADALATLLLGEPAGLCVGKILLMDGAEVLGVLGESILCAGTLEITSFGGWRPYLAHLIQKLTAPIIRRDEPD
jgi:hypothetical protein